MEHESSNFRTLKDKSSQRSMTKHKKRCQHKILKIQSNMMSLERVTLREFLLDKIGISFFFLIYLFHNIPGFSTRQGMKAALTELYPTRALKEVWQNTGKRLPTQNSWNTAKHDVTGKGNSV